MKAILSALIVLSVSNFAFASINGSTTVNDGRTVYEILSQTPKLQSQITRAGLAFQFAPIVKKLKVNWIEVTVDPDHSECQVTVTATIGQKLGPGDIIHPAPPMAGLVDPSETVENEGSCDFSDIVELIE